MLQSDHQRAIEQAELANRKGPRWAEPLSLCGDVLYLQGRPAEAAERYAAAAERAPRWDRLHMRWAAALWANSKREEAVTKLNAVAGMALSNADRGKLRAMLKVASR